MDPVSLVLTVITAAAPLVAKEVVGATVKDAYAALKGAISRKFKRGAAVAAVEEAPDSESARKGLAGALSETGAADDPEIRQLAERLAEALKDVPPDVLAQSGIDMGVIRATRDAIVENNSAAGGIRMQSIDAGQDAIVRGNRAGLSDPKA